MYGRDDDPTEVFPACCNPDCTRFVHLEKLKKNEYLAKQHCFGRIYYFDGTYLRGTLECPCTVKCKKYRCHLYSHTPITISTDPRLPYNLPDTIIPGTNPNTTVAAMRFSVVEAQTLLTYCTQKYKATLIPDLDALTNIPVKDEIRRWYCCRFAIGNNVHTKVHGRKEVTVLHIPKTDTLSDIVGLVVVKDLVWRANGNVIDADQSVYSVCGDPLCIRYEHLVAETYHEHISRVSCYNVLCIKDGEVNSVLTCNHEKKCRKIRCF